MNHFPSDLQSLYEIHEWKHASAILKSDFTEEWQDIIAMLREFRLRKSWITKAGGNKSELAVWVDQFLGKRGWCEKQFETAVIVDQERYDSPTQKVDCYKNRIALELEWNNKDPFYDRDLNNFRLLFELRAISVGVILPAVMGCSEFLTSLGVDPLMGIQQLICQNYYHALWVVEVLAAQ